MMADRVRLGIVGTGRIAQKFVEELCAVPEFDLVAVFNPHLDSAQHFIEILPVELGRPASTGSFEELLTMVEALYIASPSETHFDFACRALKSGIHVLCEKPLSFDREEIQQLYAAARECDAVFLHAVKTAFFPAFRLLEEVVSGGMIGEVVDVEASFTKLMRGCIPELAADGTGGSMRWLSTYPLYAISRFIAGKIEDASFFSQYDPRGVEVFTSAFLKFPKASASFKVGFGAKTDGALVITGTEGYVRVPAPWWNTSRFEVCYEDPRDVHSVDVPVEGSGLRYEIKAFATSILGDAAWLKCVERDDDLLFADVFNRFTEAML